MRLATLNRCATLNILKYEWSLYCIEWLTHKYNGCLCELCLNLNNLSIKVIDKKSYRSHLQSKYAQTDISVGSIKTENQKCLEKSFQHVKYAN